MSQSPQDPQQPNPFAPRPQPGDQGNPPSDGGQFPQHAQHSPQGGRHEAPQQSAPQGGQSLPGTHAQPAAHPQNPGYPQMNQQPGYPGGPEQSAYGRNPYGQSQVDHGQYDHAPYGQGGYEQGAYDQAAGFPPQQAPAKKEAGFFGPFFDFRFESFVARKYAGVFFVVSMVLALVYWAILIYFGHVAGNAARSFAEAMGPFGMGAETSYNARPLILAIVLGWIPGALLVMVSRLGLELVVASVRTAENTAEISRNH